MNGPQQDKQSSNTHGQHDPKGNRYRSRGKDSPGRNQNICEASGDAPASRRWLSLPNGPPSCCEDNGQDREEGNSERPASRQKCIVSMNYAQNEQEGVPEAEQGGDCEEPA